MTLTLAVDTTADRGSIALADETGVREEVMLDAPRGFSHVIFGEIAALLQRQGVRLEDIRLFAGASGPGSFTGVRIGLAAIKGLAETLGRPAMAISNLEAFGALGTADLRAPLIDAHRGEVFAALFNAQGATVMAESVLKLSAFVEALGERRVEWISPDETILASVPAGSPVLLAPAAMAGTIATLAIRHFMAGAVSDPAAIEANYVRRSDAELLWKEA